VHGHPLYSTTEVECLCCRSIQPIYFWSSHQPVVCKGCERHQGDSVVKTKQRNKDHIGLWGSTLALLQEEHAVEVGNLQTQIRERNVCIDTQVKQLDELREELREKLSDAPEGTIRAWFDSLAIAAANREVEKSYRSRDRAYRALWAVNEVHHSKAATEAFCSCGKRTDACSTWKAVERARPSVERWERKQLDRLAEGLDHGLPHEHPAVQAAEPWHRRYSG